MAGHTCFVEGGPPGSWVAVLLSLSLTGGLLPLAQAGHITCGQTLGPGGSFALDSDVGPCDGGYAEPALRVDSAALDLKGFTVFCEDLDGDEEVPPGIEVVGAGVRVRNGTVTGCSDGVLVEGDGRHSIEDLTAQGNSVGFFLMGPNNQLAHNTATGNLIYGFLVRGFHNMVSNNTATGSIFGGFKIEGDSNRLSGNTATGIQSKAFAIFGDKNKLSGNTAAGNGRGFDIGGESHRLSGNTATDNQEDGFLIIGNRNRLVQNHAQNNGRAGIHIDKFRDLGQNNLVVRNVAVGNAGFDLEDQNRNCDNNRWQNNKFGTRSQDCIH